MADSTLFQRIQESMKQALRDKQSARLAALRLIVAAIKQVEIDARATEKAELDDQAIIAILDKMIKQRRDSIAQYEAANRTDLAEKEAFEINIIEEFLPPKLSAAELNQLIEEAIASANATSIRDMGKVMGILKPQVQGRVDMQQVSTLIKEKLQ